METHNIVKLLNQGILPDCLNWSAREETPSFDMDKVRYNAFYKSFDYHADKFKGFDSIPGMDEYIENLANNAKLPLDEYKDRRLESARKSYLIDIKNLNIEQ